MEKEKLLPFIKLPLLVSCLISWPAIADQDAWIQELVQRAPMDIQQYAHEAKGMQQCAAQQKIFVTKDLKPVPDKILVFVSFSMPEVSLKSLAEMAERYNAVLILRGLVEESFTKTAARLKYFKSGMEVNPELFKTYKITRVPTFVLLRKDQEASRLSGNVSLPFAAEKLKGTRI